MADIEIKGSVADIARLFGRAVEEEVKVQTVKVAKEGVKAVAKKVLSAWHIFLRDFKFRKRKRNESPGAYLSARSKAASRAWKKKKKGSTKKGQVRKTARRAYER